MLRIALRTAFAYRASAIAGVLTTILSLFLLRKVWTAVYGGQSSVDGLSLDALIVYLTLANLQAFAVAPLLTFLIPLRVRDGSVFFDLVRPRSYLRQMAELQVGNTAGRLLILLPAIPVAFLIGSIGAPATWWAGFAYAFSLTLGYAIGVMLALMVAMTAFWALEASGFGMFYRLVSQFFAGTMVPLMFFPEPLRAVADLLPFRFLAYVPAAIYVGAISGPELAEALVSQVAWALALCGLVWLLWWRAHRRVVVQGG